MKFAGIIAEYDPFHNGHAWQLAQARALGAQRVAVAMSFYSHTGIDLGIASGCQYCILEHVRFDIYF